LEWFGCRKLRIAAHAVDLACAIGVTDCVLVSRFGPQILQRFHQSLPNKNTCRSFQKSKVQVYVSVLGQTKASRDFVWLQTAGAASRDFVWLQTAGAAFCFYPKSRPTWHGLNSGVYAGLHKLVGLGAQEPGRSEQVGHRSNKLAVFFWLRPIPFLAQVSKDTDYKESALLNGAAKLCGT
jgi:hypothetical protein